MVLKKVGTESENFGPVKLMTSRSGLNWDFGRSGIMGFTGLDSACSLIPMTVPELRYLIASDQHRYDAGRGGRDFLRQLMKEGGFRFTFVMRVC